MTAAAPGGSDEVAVLEAADRLYGAQQWSAAAALYQLLHHRGSAFARAHEVALALGHCLLEAQPDADTVDLIRRFNPGPPPDRTPARVNAMRVRAHELCRAGDFARAQRLLRFMSAFDAAIGITYADSILKGRSGCWEASLDGSAAAPGFLAARRWRDDDLAALKQWAQGRRVLMIQPWSSPYRDADRYRRSAIAFGFTTLTLDLLNWLGDFEPASVAARLQGALDTFRPDIVVHMSLVELVTVPNHAALRERTERVLETARRERGIQVVATFYDAWIAPTGEIPLLLGRSADLVQHCHPGLLAHPLLADPRIYCYFPPVLVAPPSAPAATIPRALVSGGVNYSNVSRLVWWAETAPRGLPIDFVETNVYDAATMRSAEDYTNLMREHQLIINLTRRSSGVHIVTGRSLEVPAAGGVLLQEDGGDTGYFLTPGVHYVPFRTLADLTELIPWLLDNPEYRQRLAAAGPPWIARHFSGDGYWAELLDRLARGRLTGSVSS